MTDQTAAAARPVQLDTPVTRGETTIDTLHIRKPKAGELRGLNMADVCQLNVNALCTLLPRITVPPITPAEVAALDPADFLALSAEVADFLLQKDQRASLPA